ncbi:MAG TPA: Cro/CI family transcriptional regulator [Burkholderiales bacterium]|nr:Cro/CI family transcriptional regulator [Burkholderiales bacterium]
MVADTIIDRLGGTGEVAKLCEVSPAAVSQWRHDGIPKARMMYLRAVRPDVFEDETVGDQNDQPSLSS